MKFSELKEKVGLGLAVVICIEKFRQHDDLSQRFFSKLTFDQWLEIRSCQHLPEEYKNWAFEGMGLTIKTPEQLLEAYNQYETFGFFDEAITDRVQASAQSFDDWYALYEIDRNDEVLQKQDLRKMGETADSKDQWIIVCKKSLPNSELEKKAIQTLSSKAQTIDDWLEFCNILALGSDERIPAFQKIQALAQTFDDWHKVAMSHSILCEQREIAFQNMGTLAKTFDDWHKVAECSVNRSAIHIKALEELGKFADELDVLA